MLKSLLVSLAGESVWLDFEGGRVMNVTVVLFPLGFVLTGEQATTV